MITRRQILRTLPAALVPCVRQPMLMGREQTEADVPASANRAQRLTDQLLQGMEQGPREYVPEKLGIFTADVEDSVDTFGRQLRYCLKNRVPMWSAIFPNWPPIVLDWSLPVDPPWLGTSERLDALYRAVFETYEQMTKQSVEEVGFVPRQVPPDEARKYFADELVAFLTTRFSSVKPILASPEQHKGEPGAFNLRLSSPKSNPVTAGLQFRVYTRRDGLRVYYSPSYFINTHLVFGSPTSPVDGWIQPGRYIFGTAGPGCRPPLRWDRGEFDIPPMTEARLTI